MNKFQLVLLAACVAVACAGPLPSSNDVSDSSPGDNSQQLAESGVALSRPRRWILSWLLGHGAITEHIDSKQNNTTSSRNEDNDDANSARDENKKDVSTRHGDDDVTSAEVHDLPGTVPVDLSRDTLVNYQEGRSRVGALAHETDAEVFDWNLLQEDKNRNTVDVNPHYYQSNSVQPVVRGGVSHGYGFRRSRPATGILSSTREQGRTEQTTATDGHGQQRLNSFNRFPISFEQSQEYDNFRRRN